MPVTESGFDRHVFINCPFDDEFRPLLRVLLFTVLDCGLRPRIASESFDSGEVRIHRIRELIVTSRYSIHDLSRITPLRPGNLPRFNMPFELGLDLGCRFYGDGRLQRKRCLILDKEPYRYQEVLSDISGQDILAHGDDPETLIAKVRGWLKVTTQRRLQSGSTIWQRFSEFTSQLELDLMRDGFTADEIQNLEVPELLEHAETWIGSGGSS